MTTILVDRDAERDAGSVSSRSAVPGCPVRIILIALALILLNGCGLKGDLYLPDNQTPATPPTALEEQPDAEDDDAD